MEKRTRTVILAHRRSGSTMLCYALSNHPEVHCARGEPLHRKNSWRWALGGAGTPWGSQVYKRIIGLTLNQWGYKACVAKINWGPGTEEVWNWLAALDPPIRAIYLIRRNRLRQAVSDIIRTTAKKAGRPRDHTHERLPVYRMAFEPRMLLCWMETLESDAKLAQMRLDWADIPYIGITYAELVRKEGKEVGDLPVEVSGKLCRWLEVDRRTLSVGPLRRINPYPLSEIVENWPDVEAAVERSAWAHCLEDEERWK